MSQQSLHSIYLDYQATTPVSDVVLQEMVPFFREKFGNPHASEHFSGWEAGKQIDIAKDRIANMLGANYDELLFTSGATEANNIALHGLVSTQQNHKNRIIVSEIEHKSVLSTVQAIAKANGYYIEYLPVDSEGYVSQDSLEEMLDDRVLLVSIMAVNNEIGTIQDIESISNIVHKHEAIFHCDAAQAPIATDLSSVAHYVDALSLSSHKMYGPPGIGVLFLRGDLHSKIKPLCHGGNQQSGIRPGTLPLPLCVGMGVAAKQFNDDTAKNKREQLRKKSLFFLNQLELLPFPILLNGPTHDARHPGNINISFVGYSASDILNTLQPNVAASTGSACSSGTLESSYVLKAIGLSPEQVAGSIRFSLGYETSEKDIVAAITYINNALESLPF